VSRDKLLYDALRIRMTEEKIIELYPTDVIQSPVHLSIGQEAVAVGVCANLQVNDWVFINYRGHAFYLAKGGSLPKFFAELMGKIGGVSKGKAGSMHLAAPEQGVMGASAVVASTIPHAVGAALASKVKGEKNRIFVANFGDGAMEQGVFFESMNFAALHQLPVLFLCEDNGLAVHTCLSDRQSFDVSKLVKAFGIEYSEIEDGFDPSIVMNQSKKSIDFVKTNQSPAFLRVKTARYKEHVGPGEDFSFGYRSEIEMNLWKAKDPLYSMANFEILRMQISDEINDAVTFAFASQFPDQRELLTDVY
jgi:pyruvate dehydrogenase E1 component alpha subunit